MEVSNKLKQLVAMTIVGAIFISAGIFIASAYRQNNAPTLQPPSSRQVTGLNKQDTLSPGGPAQVPPNKEVKVEDNEGVPTIRDKNGTINAVHEGEYVNEQYGYRVLIPEGLQGLSSPPPMPQHGFHIDVANTDAYVTVYASYNMLPESSLEDVVKARIKKIKQDLNVAQLKQNSTYLDKLSAAHIVYKYNSPKTGQTMIEDETIAVRIKRGTELAIIYEITLGTQESRYTEDQKTLEQVIKTWSIRGYQIDCVNGINQCKLQLAERNHDADYTRTLRRTLERLQVA